MKKIEIVEYDPNWPVIFRNLQVVFEKQLYGLIESVEHIGSTSVPGLAAKPIIDIDLIIANGSALPLVIEKLDHLGYDHRGNLGIVDREAFRRRDEYVPYGNGQVWPVHHLYVCTKGSNGLINHLVLRDYLRNNPDKAQEYATLKRQLAARYPTMSEAYVDGKTAFIMSIVGPSLQSS